MVRATSQLHIIVIWRLDMDVVATGPDDEALLLDLLNTTPVVDGVPRDELERSEEARAWMGERGIAATNAELTALREARSALQEVVRGEQTACALQHFLAAVTLRPVATGNGLDWDSGKRAAPGSGARRAGMGCAADLKPRLAAAVRQHGVPTVPDRPQ